MEVALSDEVMGNSVSTLGTSAGRMHGFHVEAHWALSSAHFVKLSSRTDTCPRFPSTMPMLPSSQTASPTPSRSQHPPTPSSSAPTFLSTIRATLAPAPAAALLSDLAPHIFRSGILSSPHFSHRNSLATSVGSSSQSIRGRLGWPTGRVDLNGLYIIHQVDELLDLECPASEFDEQVNGGMAEQVPLIMGFRATTPGALGARLSRRKQKISVGGSVATIQEGAVLEEEGLGINKRAVGGAARRPRKSIRVDEVEMTREELERDANAVGVDMRNVAVRRVSITVVSDAWRLLTSELRSS